MARAGPDLGADQRLDVGRAGAPIDDVPDILLGREPDHDPEAVAAGRIEQRAGGRRVGNPHAVDTVRRHLGEVPLDGGEVVVFVAGGIGLKRAVRHAADEELFVTRE